MTKRVKRQSVAGRRGFWRTALRRARRGLDRLRGGLDRPVSCGEGCYTLSDGTVVPLGDLGVTPTEYSLRE